MGVVEEMKSELKIMDGTGTSQDYALAEHKDP